MLSLRQKVLFCIIPIIILDGSWVTFIKSHAWGRGLIASINLIQPLWDVVVDGQARPDGGRSSPVVLRSHWFSLAVRNSHGSSLLGLTAGFSDAQFDCLTWILRHGALIKFVQRCDIAIDPMIWCEFICAFSCSSLGYLLLMNGRITHSFVCLWLHVCVWVYVCMHATHLIVSESLFFGNSKEILLDLPLHLFCVMSLPAMWCSLLSDWQAVIKKSSTWPHLHWTDETRV